MKKKKINIWQIISIIFIVISIILAVNIVTMKNRAKGNKVQIKNDSETSQTQGTPSENQIRLIERLIKDGNVEGLKNVRWTDATIRQEYNYIFVEIRLTNESETEKVDSKTITANLYDKNGNEIATQEAQMDEIAENYAFTTINFNFDVSDIELIYDIQLTAK